MGRFFLIHRFLKSTGLRTVLFILTLLIVNSTNAAGVFGDGSDGSATIVGTVDLVSDMNYTDLTVSAGATLETHGYAVRVSGTLLNLGTITDSYSGGTGGTGGPGGVGGTGACGHNPPKVGINGSPGGGPSIGGAGLGGNGGSGGGGGGGAWNPTDCEYARGGNGGKGGDGGNGGGFVNIFANNFDNQGIVHANAQNGSPGIAGQLGTYTSYIYLFFTEDMAGGGGGGGGGGNGGNGGTVNITYGALINTGSTSAFGGSLGVRGPGGGSINTNESNHGGDQIEENGAIGGTSSPTGGTGGRGEFESTSSQPGADGQNGTTGFPGAVNFVAAKTCYVDADADGYGDSNDPGTPTTGCSSGFVDNNADCDDTNPDIHPGAAEIPDNGVDDDCDGLEDNTCYADNDADGYGDPNNSTISSGSCTSGFVDNDQDCDDTNPDIHPGAAEIPGNGIDEDCDGLDASFCYADNDQDTYGDPDNFVVSSGPCQVGYVVDNTDCHDGDPNIHPGATDIPGNGIDEDCDGLDASCCIGIRGNYDGDITETIDVSDLVYMIDYQFRGGPAPDCFDEGDFNADGVIDVSDIVLMVDYQFNGGPAPDSCL